MLSLIVKIIVYLYDLLCWCFINNVKKIGGVFIKDRIEMIWWSNVWMFYVFSVK